MNNHIIFNELQPGNVFEVEQSKGVQVQKLYRVRSKTKEWNKSEMMFTMGNSH